jgi:hypothetical protein
MNSPAQRPPSIILEALRFNSPTKAASKHVINLRRDGKRALTLPEWQQGVSHKPEDSPVAYQMDLCARQSVQISARFRRTDPSGSRSVTVRAVPDDSVGRNLLGPIAPTKVLFEENHLSDWVTLDLHEHQLAGAGVGVWNLAWNWDVRHECSWTTFDRSEHRVFTTLRAPQDPWQQDPFNETNIRIPWVDALEYACRWAQGARTQDEAAYAITKQINDLGPTLLEYECGVTPGNSVYGFFRLTSFLDLLNGGPGRGRTVACTDCSCAVVIFANLLGCELWKIDINTEPIDGSPSPAPQFEINPILVIGSSAWGIPCGLTGFGFHSVACKSELEPDDRVFDACLRVAECPGETRNPVLPANMRFGTRGSGDYLDRLVAPAARDLAIPQGWGRFRPNIFDL